MLNKKKVIIACTVAFLLVLSVLGTIVLTASELSNSEENITKKDEVNLKKDEMLASSSDDKDSEGNEKTEETNKNENNEKIDEIKAIEVSEEKKEANLKREEGPSLKIASRGSSLTPRNTTTIPKKVVATPAPQTVAPKPVETTSKTINGWSEADMYWLAKIIHAESRGEPYEGQVAVGAVILRRVHHPDFPNTVKDVIFAKWHLGAKSGYEFSPVADGSIWLEPNVTAYKAATDAANGWDPSGGALYFYNPAKSTSQWIFSRPITTKIGQHVFAK